MGKDSKSKKHKNEKKHKKEKSRKRERDSSSERGSDSEEERQRLRAEKKAKKVEEYWNQQAKKGGPTKFVWGKKIERDLLKGADVREFTAASQQRKHDERMAEIEKVQKRREEREAEKQRMEEELALLQRQRLAAEAVEQEQKEEEFHLQQAQVRAARRVAQGRAKPVDWLVQDLYGLGEDGGGQEFRNDEADDSEEEREELRRQVQESMDDWAAGIGAAPQRRDRPQGWRDGQDRYGQQQERVGFARPRDLSHKPYQVMFGLAKDDLLELRDEIKGYQELESRVTPLHAEYWGCLLTLADHELEAQRLHEDMLREQGVLPRLDAAQGLNRYREETAPVPQYIRAVGAPLPRAAGTGVHATVQREIENLLAGQGFKQLSLMESDIQRKLAQGEGDPEYWEAVLPRLTIYAAKARLRELKAEMLENRLREQEEKLDVAAAMGWHDEAEDEADKEARRLGDGVEFPAGAAHIVKEGDIPLSDSEDEARQQAPSQPARHPDEELEAELAEQQQQHDSDWEPDARGADSDEEAAAAAVRLSPPPVSAAELASGELEVVSAEEDRRMIELMRQQVRIREAEKFMSAAEIAAKGVAESAADRAYQEQLLDSRNRPRGPHPMLRNVAGGVDTGLERLNLARPQEQLDEQTRRFRDQALKQMGYDEGDRNFGVEVPVEQQAQLWHNRYAPRKPKYFNRIHTGYEWNKYNQTHYDTENPPPKVVQGYKFNIFYPDLLDKTVAPTYRVEPDPTGSKDTCILVFSAGPPYEDIAFRIVNKEWETTQRRGFKCTFDRGILHLYFNFKRARYRR